jgi:hypothetical protein
VHVNIGKAINFNTSSRRSSCFSAFQLNSVRSVILSSYQPRPFAVSGLMAMQLIPLRHGLLSESDHSITHRSGHAAAHITVMQAVVTGRGGALSLALFNL